MFCFTSSIAFFLYFSALTPESYFCENISCVSEYSESNPALIIPLSDSVNMYGILSSPDDLLEFAFSCVIFLLPPGSLVIIKLDRAVSVKPLLPAIESIAFKHAALSLFVWHKIRNPVLNVDAKLSIGARKLVALFLCVKSTPELY